MQNVIVLGSLNMDLSIQCDNLPKNGETINGSDFFMNPGGKGGNQAVAAAKLGANTRIIAQIGDDVFGKELLATIHNYGVNTDCIQISTMDTTGIAMIIRSYSDNRIILGNGANHTLDIQHVKHCLQRIAKPNDIFLTQLENEYELVKQSIIEAKNQSLFTILNPAPARMLDDELYRNVDLIIVNQSECKLLTGLYPKDEKTSIQALQIFKKNHVDAILTLGTNGSVTNYQNELLFIKAKQVETRDTTAAGDSFIGAICSYLANGKRMEEALAFATKVAAITVTRKGAQISIPYSKEVSDYFKEE